MKIVIVGGTGNISSSIVNLLLKLGHEVVCFNRGKKIGELLDKLKLFGDELKDRFRLAH